MQEFQHKKLSEELAIGMVAHNEVLEQLDDKVKEGEHMSKKKSARPKIDARDQALCSSSLASALWLQL